MHIQGLPPRYPKQRRFRRFGLQFPVALSFPAGEVAHKLEGLSQNVSVRGLLVKAADRIPLRTSVRLTMNVAGPKWRRTIRVVGEGRVVRVEPLDRDTGYAIAVECKQPMRELQQRSPAGC